MLKKSIIKTLVAAALIGATVTGCAPNINSNSYDMYSAGQINQTIPGVIYSSRIVAVGGTSGFGAIAGGVMGAVAGSAIGGGRGSILGGVGGAVLGAGLGNAVEGRLNRQWGVEYVVRTCDGAFLTVVQGGPCMYQRGQHVFVIMGDCQSRIIPDPNFG